MLINLHKLTPDQAYFALIQSVIPRPIAWVLSGNGDGSHNLAPFSFFNAVCGNPPLIAISIGRKPDGARKDTWVNIDARDHFVVHVPSREQGEAMVATSATLPHGESELTRVGLTTQAIDSWPLPRVIGPRVALLCEKFAIHELGPETQGLILGRVHAIYLDEAVAAVRDGRLFVDAAKVDPLARLGGSEYVEFGKVVSIARPK